MDKRWRSYFGLARQPFPNPRTETSHERPSPSPDLELPRYFLCDEGFPSPLAKSQVNLEPRLHAESGRNNSRISKDFSRPSGFPEAVKGLFPEFPELESLSSPFREPFVSQEFPPLYLQKPLIFSVHRRSFYGEDSAV